MNTQNAVYQALEKAGWYKGREIDITSVLHSYSEYNLILSSKAIDIFKEFYGLKNIWYFDIKFPNNSKSFSVKQIEFEFQLFSAFDVNEGDAIWFMYEDFEKNIKTDNYKQVLEFSKENVVAIGEIGYYYPACLWIGDSGKIYCTHEYDDKILIFDTIYEIIFGELSSFEIIGLHVNS